MSAMSWARCKSRVWSIHRGGGFCDRFFRNPLPLVSVDFPMPLAVPAPQDAWRLMLVPALGRCRPTPGPPRLVEAAEVDAVLVWSVLPLSLCFGALVG